jgi:DNA-binding PadR family transcriptional regulator
VEKSGSQDDSPKIFDEKASKPGLSSAISLRLIDLELLCLLSRQDSAGYGLRLKILDEFGIKLSYGTLYPHLRFLEKAGLVAGQRHAGTAEARKNGSKRVLAITEKGRTTLNRNIEEAMKTIEKIRLLAAI